VDLVSFGFAFLTLSISVFVNIFAFSYFRYEPNVGRLVTLLNSFVLSMVFLVCSGNFAMLLLGWELIGLTSFLLINFWATRVATLKSAFKAYSFNKLSDVSMLTAVVALTVVLGNTSFCEVMGTLGHLWDLNLVHLLGLNLIEFSTFFLLTAAFVKSAQFGFHIWLPDSMEAPVPASALIHSATLVSAGVFLILRLHPLLELSIIFTFAAPMVGSLTALVGGVGAIFQTDLKRILAYSTISHCGFLVFLGYFGYGDLILVYLYVHGFFKASVFLCAGNIIRLSKNYQDVRRMGGL
jgi:NADH:ubiquinone oxidoreductase subunit 5 (subunit L)/multisubunit Na+/H+ antiporter MnhA subunit